MAIGIIELELWAQMVSVSPNTNNVEGAAIITAEPPAEAYTNQYAEAANAALTAEGLNTTGDAYAPIEVVLNEGGN